jgi:hypothetical protein
MFICILRPVTTIACSDPAYCITKNAFHYLEQDKIITVDFTTKLKKVLTPIPKDIYQDLKARSCWVSCTDSSLTLSYKKGFLFEVDPHNKVKYRKEVTPTQNTSQSLDENHVPESKDIYTNRIYKVRFTHYEIQEARNGAIDHKQFNLIKKIDLKTEKVLEEMSLYEGTRLETID